MLPPSPDTWTIFEAAHLLNRAGFGGSPSSIKAFHALGRTKAVESLISPEERIDAFPVPTFATKESIAENYNEYQDAVKKVVQETRDLPKQEADELRRKARQKVQRKRRDQALEAQGWWFRRMLASEAPLREKMTLFWHDHFATSFQKVKQPALLVKQNELFRSQAFGSFKELTKSVVRDPAMLLYLDSQNSKKGMPNENFSREVLELFTLGEGNYSEEDIHQAARAFTGYRIERTTATVTFRKVQWDDGSKTVFGKSGAFKGEELVDLIFEQKAASELVPRKLWEYFVAENPSQEVVDSLSAAFRAADFRTGPLLREIFLSQEFYSDAMVRNQIKPPVQFMVQMLKQLEIDEPPAGFPLRGQQELGQQLFSPPNVAGWDWGKAWINTNTLLTRYNLAGFLTKGSDDSTASEKGGGDAMMMEDGAMKRNVAVNRRMLREQQQWKGPDYEKIAPRPLRENPEELVDSLIFRFFQGPLPDKARASFIEYATAKQGVIFTNTEVAELAHLILSTPYYQLS